MRRESETTRWSDDTGCMTNTSVTQTVMAAVQVVAKEKRRQVESLVGRANKKGKKSRRGCRDGIIAQARRPSGGVFALALLLPDSDTQACARAQPSEGELHHVLRRCNAERSHHQ